MADNIFLNLLDIAGFAAFVVWTTENSQRNSKLRHRRRFFLLEVGCEHVNDHVNRRRQQPHVLQKNVALAL